MREVALLFVTVLCLSSLASAEEGTRPQKLHVHGYLSEVVSQDTLSIPIDDVFYVSKEFWSTDTGISCTGNVFGTGDGKIQGTFECKARGGYKGQIPFSCELNSNETDPAVLFFGKVGVPGSNRTFKLWCA